MTCLLMCCSSTTFELCNYVPMRRYLISNSSKQILIKQLRKTKRGINDMGLALEIIDFFFRLLWSIVERAYRLVIPVPRKKIDGEVVLITGGGGKIGECIALEMAKLNVKIVLWDINEEANERVASKVRKQGATVFAFRCDLTDKKEVYRLAEEVERQVGHVTVLVNNAGVLFNRSLLNCSDKELEKTVEINTTSHFWTTKAFLPHMFDIDHGHIVTIASMAGLFGTPNLVGYCASKFGAIGFHESLRQELRSLGKTGVKTTCICPLFVDTPLISIEKVKARYSFLFPISQPEYVAEQLVDGVLRDKNYVLIPKTFHINVLLSKLLPDKSVEILLDFYAAGIKPEKAEETQKRREEAAENEKKNS